MRVNSGITSELYYSSTGVKDKDNTQNTQVNNDELSNEALNPHEEKIGSRKYQDVLSLQSDLQKNLSNNTNSVKSLDEINNALKIESDKFKNEDFSKLNDKFLDNFKNAHSNIQLSQDMAKLLA
ncbi:hypothetical protein [Campylobacter canadensis]|uniref:Uncharacterized protein n=1 Tax=Campylobacter canadensis TaxID=449520 RepID=A0ABS7WQ40_9BACT|nr:hypothetical protein [Campylobacter canadensis]MBZ7986623.1 hypothetical protein [Campylobacter canadensis]MBZ7993972.1 hypothetical protein [Campylobacter canadensis]MBZ7996288.1 hypothetical protein [Campylobacter canadensis]MBZ7997659.1 hypothetical protein [Campylobacter canadensis]MBZ7999304.1 hypothetical protein [Campylobacter canadensis]